MLNQLNSKVFNYGLFEVLKKRGVHFTPEMRKKIEERIDAVLSYEPRIGVFGKTGVGKSSLCNALFGQDICPVSDVEACTRDTKEVLLNIGTKGLKLVDVPGVGESASRDQEYEELYNNLLPELDVVFWVLKGDDRAFSSDAKFYNEVVKPHLEQGKPFFIVLNQIDKIEPFREWDLENCLPGPKQQKNINAKIEMVSKYFEVPTSKIIPVSADEKYGLIRLIDEIVFGLPKDKKITFAKGVSKGNVSKQAEGHAKKGFIQTVDEFCQDVLPGYGVMKHVIHNVWESVTSKCYITSSACLALGKGDHCEELNLFRRFRDKWLVHQNGGKADIEEYYRVAPKIVDQINSQPDSDAIYKKIWEDHLNECLQLIQKKSYVETRMVYSNMVNTLKKHYAKD
ncbi:GTPase family protein [Metabacillus schmidteae]|uniref:GTPase family protein n=1 Tax=Metabacillus schmidteae TaxID=2730405 RepID=UPI001588887B|nr:GTPase [Metabacillus schmidteae]